MRISLSDNKYRVIRLPTEDREFYLGKSINNVMGHGSYNNFTIGDMNKILMKILMWGVTKQLWKRKWERNLSGTLTMIMFSNMEVGARILTLSFMDFNPYKEVVFLSDKFDRVLAYNWSSSKLQDLGQLFPKFYIERDLLFQHRLASASFPYTPCWLGELPEKQN